MNLGWNCLAEDEIGVADQMKSAEWRGSPGRNENREGRADRRTGLSPEHSSFGHRRSWSGRNVRKLRENARAYVLTVSGRPVTWPPRIRECASQEQR